MTRFQVRPTLLAAVVALLSFGLTATRLNADVVATGFFSGTIERFDATTGAQSTLATIASPTDPFPGLSGLAYDATSNVIYASGRISNKIYRVDAATGSVLGFQQLASDSAPAGLALDGAGNLYVSNNGGNTISVFDSAGNSIATIDLPNVIGVADNLPNGLAFDNQGRLVISTFAGAGLFRYDPVSNVAGLLAASPLANGQVAVDAAGDILVGGAAFSSEVLKFTEAGTPIGSSFLTIDDALLLPPALPFASPNFTSPTGVTIDADGNVIVAALGRTNPTSAADNFQENGGLWKFAPDGSLLQTFVTNTPLSSVITITAIPEPGSLAGLLSVATAGMLRRRRRA